MWARLGGDALLVIHFLWIIFLIVGLPLGLYFKLRALRIVHAMGLIFALILQLTHTFCPLTIWEEYLRNLHHPDFTYKGSFIITSIEKLVYPGWITLKTITIITAFFVGVTLLSFILIPLPPRKKEKTSSIK